MKVKALVSVLVLVATMISASSSSTAAAKVGNGLICQKPGEKATVKKVIYTCVKELPKPKWRVLPKITTPTPTPTPSPSVAKLAVTPIVSLLANALPPKRVVIKNGALASIYVDFSSKLTTSKYYLVMNQTGSCWSGSTNFSQQANIRLENTIERGLFSSIDFGKIVKVIEIPRFPLSLECYLYPTAEYKFIVIETPLTTQYTFLSISSVTSVIYSDYVAPTPKPTVTPTYSSDLKIIAGQMCAPEGFSSKAADGLTYMCKKSTADSSLRWVLQG